MALHLASYWVPPAGTKGGPGLGTNAVPWLECESVPFELPAAGDGFTQHILPSSPHQQRSRGG